VPSGIPVDKNRTCSICRQPFQRSNSRQMRCKNCALVAKRARSRVYLRQWRVDNKDKVKAIAKNGLPRHREYIREVHSEVIAFYSNETFRCECCAFGGSKSFVPFLELDHIEPVRAHSNGIRQLETGSGWWLRLRKAIKRRHPIGGIRVLCGTCNRAKRDYADCPHTSMSNLQLIREHNLRGPI
jgi:hypothetical protein